MDKKPTYEELEQRVKALEQESVERKKVEEEQTRSRVRLEALWNLARMVDADYKTLCDNVLVQIKAMTQSEYALYGFLNEDESVLTIYSWTKKVSSACRVSGKPVELSVERGGLWTVAVRERRTLIINDYSEPASNR